MDIAAFTRPALPLTTLAFLLFALVLPSVRLRRRTGRPALVLHRSGPPLQRIIGVGMALFMLAIVLWSGAHLALGEQALALWHVPDAIRWSGWALVAVGFFVTVRAQVQMGASWRIGIDSERTELVTGGLFGIVRNPIFSGMLTVVTGVTLATPSAWTVMGWLDYVLLVSLQVRLEEEHLLRLHGNAYERYAERVGRFVPGVGRLASPTAPVITV
ncbi:isoprenylcysteine carboxylmethyltransferase family protein [Corallococcus sp. ZKHCc1 1396]|uniref:Isoprenylcysteine carboxylmethyltransferase family protein n=1 Tax=Corallococcus soli TaxID=2710757 RepID=A0ABR9PWT7_9BACT|nr:isoprenylcysteine carboxylmethyltransferase family protein [Corallococcus soli]MBE4752388.1 isoprenylcysteine carboxylmethyltransferase family protein [Corallococcus soli]